MKYIIAILQPDRLDEVLDLLTAKQIHLVTVTNVLGKENGIIAANGDNNAGSNLRVVAFAAVTTEHRPFGFARMHGVATVAAEFVRAIKLRQLHAAPGKLEQADVLIEHLAHRSHIMAARLLNQPHRRSFPFTNLQRALPHKIEIYRFAMWYFATGQP